MTNSAELNLALRDALNGESRNQLEWIIEQASKWQPDGYRAEIGRRILYLQGDMEDDLKDLLREEFPKLYKDIVNKLIQYPVAQYIAQKKAQVFRGKGARHYLIDENGEEPEQDDPQVESFNEMLEQSGVESSLVELDEIMEVAHEAILRWWFDPVSRRLQSSAWSPDRVYVAVNPFYPYSTDASFATAFEKTGFDGVGSFRYEVWGLRDVEISGDQDSRGLPIYGSTVHYEAALDGPTDQINSFDENPFTWRDNGEAMLPYEWFSDRRGDIYSAIGGDQLIQLTRNICLNMTWLNHNVQWQMTPVPVFEVDSGSEQWTEFQKTFVMSPKHAWRIPPGVRFSFVSPTGEVRAFTDAYEMMMQYSSLFNNLSPKHLDVRNGLPQSGIALRIEFDNLVKYREKRIQLYRPHVIRAMERGIVVWNQYCRELGYQQITKYYPEWSPGTYEAVVDYNELASRYQQEIASNVSTPVDWYMELRSVADRASAEEAIRNNIELNRELRAEASSPSAIQAKDGEVEIGMSGEDYTKPVAQTENIQQQVLNGAQVKSLLEIAQTVSAGTLPRDTAIGIIMVAFQLSREMADMVLASAGSEGSIAATRQAESITPAEQPQPAASQAEAEKPSQKTVFGGE